MSDIYLKSWMFQSGNIFLSSKFVLGCLSGRDRRRSCCLVLRNRALCRLARKVMDLYTGNVIVQNFIQTCLILFAVSEPDLLANVLKIGGKMRGIRMWSSFE
jgi:hypothetical protein